MDDDLKREAVAVTLLRLERTIEANPNSILGTDEGHTGDPEATYVSLLGRILRLLD